jgi:hypothetical protein
MRFPHLLARHSTISATTPALKVICMECLYQDAVLVIIRTFQQKCMFLVLDLVFVLDFILFYFLCAYLLKCLKSVFKNVYKYLNNVKRLKRTQTKLKCSDHIHTLSTPVHVRVFEYHFNKTCFHHSRLVLFLKAEDSNSQDRGTGFPYKVLPA